MKRQGIGGFVPTPGSSIELSWTKDQVTRVCLVKPSSNDLERQRRRDRRPIFGTARRLVVFDGRGWPLFCVRI